MDFSCKQTKVRFSFSPQNVLSVSLMSNKHVKYISLGMKHLQQLQHFVYIHVFFTTFVGALLHFLVPHQLLISWIKTNSGT